VFSLKDLITQGGPTDQHGSRGPRTLGQTNPLGLSVRVRIQSAAPCAVVSNVRSSQRRGEPWVCVWCKAANDGYSPRDDPATATLGDLAADMARHGLEFASRESQQQRARDTQPVLIVTINEVPGYRISQVHGDVFGLIVRARGTFSNLGAQLRTLAGGRSPGTQGC
jgi:Putative heavy-metal-binding